MRVRSRIFRFISSKSLEFRAMSVHSQNSIALHWRAQIILKGIAQSSQVCNCCQKRKDALPLLFDHPPFLDQQWTGSTMCHRRYRQENSENNSALYIGAVIASWVDSGPEFSSCNRTITLQGLVYPFIGALMPDALLRRRFNRCTSMIVNFGAQDRQRTRSARELDFQLI